jgi:hypothetical protein
VEEEMVTAGPRRSLISSIQLSLLLAVLMPSGTAAGEVLMEEDFSGPLRDGWILYGEPLPMRCDSAGLPAPCFDNNGDTMYDSGALSRDSWDYSEGLVLECDMYVTSNERGAWIAGTLGLAVAEDVEYGQDGISPVMIRLCYNYLGEANWACPHLQGQLLADITLPDGSKDEFELVHLNDYMDEWHRFRIVIEEDLTVSFYVDSLLMRRTEESIPPGLGEMSVVLGNRSNAWGRVFHDNILLRTL